MAPISDRWCKAEFVGGPRDGDGGFFRWPAPPVLGPLPPGAKADPAEAPTGVYQFEGTDEQTATLDPTLEPSAALLREALKDSPTCVYRWSGAE